MFMCICVGYMCAGIGQACAHMVPLCGTHGDQRSLWVCYFVARHLLFYILFLRQGLFQNPKLTAFCKTGWIHSLRATCVFAGVGFLRGKRRSQSWQVLIGHSSQIIHFNCWTEVFVLGMINSQVRD